MEILERIWELISNLFTGLSGKIERAITSLFGSSNARYIKKLQPRVEAINAFAQAVRQPSPILQLQAVKVALAVIGRERQVIPLRAAEAAHFAPQQIAAERARVA